MSSSVAEEDRIVFQPNVQDLQVGQCSIDLRLAADILRFKRPFFLIFNKVFDIKRSDNVDMYKIGTIERSGFVIKPGELIIGRTIESIKMPKNKFGLVTGRSTYSRLGLEIQLTKELKQPGHNGVFPLEIKNNSPFPIKLYPGTRIAQLLIGQLDEYCTKGYDESNEKWANELSLRSRSWTKDSEFTDEAPEPKTINVNNLLNLFLIVSLIFTLIFAFEQLKLVLNPWSITAFIIFAITLVLRIIIYIKK